MNGVSTLSGIACPSATACFASATGGYWLMGSDGGIFSFEAPFYGAD